MGVNPDDVFNTLQIYLGSLYVNDFNRFGRTWQVIVQADGAFRDDPDKVKLLKVRNASGEMVPLGALLDVTRDRRAAHHRPLQHVPGRRRSSATPAPGVSSGQGIDGDGAAGRRRAAAGHGVRVDRDHLHADRTPATPAMI